MIFTAGTGILPFLDLFEYLLKKLIYTVIKDRFGVREASLVNLYNEDYERTFGDSFRITLYCAFANKAECYGYQILSDLHSFCTEFDIPWFNATARFASSETDPFLPTTKHYFDSAFLQNVLPISPQTNPTKIMLCGPPDFNKNLYNILTTNHQFHPSRVQLV